jgi:hypothetical protein
MHVEDYITTVGKQHRNERQNFEFRSISTLREFIEGAIKNCTIPDVIKSVCPVNLLPVDGKCKYRLKDKMECRMCNY